MSDGSHRIPASQWTPYTIHTRLLFKLLLKSAKQPVPHNKQTTIVSIKINIILGVVYAVIGRGYKKPLIPAQLRHMLGMHPKLINQIDCAHRHHNLRRNPQQVHGYKKYPTEQEAGTCLAQGSAQIVVFTLMMRHVSSPHNNALVTDPVHPIIAKII